MKIVNIMGGLGNQMFQYAFAETLRIAFPHEDIYIDTHHYKYKVRISLFPKTSAIIR